MGGTSAGLFKYDKETDNFLNFTDESCYNYSRLTIWITEDHERNLWLSTSKGIIRLNKQRNSAAIIWKEPGCK